jgi:hypothetical protein
MSNRELERAGIVLLIPCLQKLGQSVSKQKGTFDLSVDGSDAEVKAKDKSFATMDFITYTQNQYDAIREGRKFDTYVICGLEGKPEAYKLPSQSLQCVKPTIWTSYSYYRKDLESLLTGGLMTRIL